jgi:hypothetical protein
MKIRFLFLLANLFLSSLAWGAAPAWLNGEASKYPNAQYLVGRGEGSTESEAQNRARGDLASVFEVRIAVVTQNATTVTQATGQKTQVNKQATQQVSAKTDKVISGITIAEIWRDPVTQDFHVLAVLSRAHAAASLREEVSRIDQETQQFLQAANSATDPLLKIGALTQAWQSTVKREGFQSSLQVVDPSGRGAPPEVTQASVQMMINDTLKSVRIAPVVVEDSAVAEFAGILKGGLAAAGFLATQSTEAEFTLEGKLSFNDLGRRDNWNWMRATLEISLVEKATHRVRGSKTWPVKASAQDAKTARSRALLEIEKVLNQQLRATLLGFAAH